MFCDHSKVGHAAIVIAAIAVCTFTVLFLYSGNEPSNLLLWSKFFINGFNATQIAAVNVMSLSSRSHDAPVSTSLANAPAPSSASFNSLFSGKQTLDTVLKKAADGNNNTVIVSTINQSWASSLLDLFLGTFRNGDDTEELLKHLVLVALDHKAYLRCQQVHRYCYALFTEGTDFHRDVYFMTPTYLEMLWRRTKFLLAVLEMGYNFVFTDADILWFRNPFPQFYQDADFQVACDKYLGNPDSLWNSPNCGFQYVKSNNRSIELFKFWYASRQKYPGAMEQTVLNNIKFDPFISDIGVKIKFLHTDYFGGLCAPSRDFNKVCTMHTNCCIGKNRKLNDLKLMQEDWQIYKSLPPQIKKQEGHKLQWSAYYCHGRKVATQQRSYRAHKKEERKGNSMTLE